MKKGVKITLMVVGIVMAVIIFFVGAVLLIITSEDFGTSRKYRTYKYIFTEFNEGEEYTKESIFEIAPKLDYIGYSNGEGQGSKYGEEEKYKELAFQKDVVLWVYDCSLYGYPYRLEISFDEKGNATQMEFDPIPGG